MTGLVIYLGYKWDTPKPITAVHALVSLWTGLATLNYTAGFVNSEYTIFLDWIITTPLLILSLSLTAGKGNLAKPIQSSIAAGLQAAVIYLGYLSLTTGQTTYFFLSSLLFLAVAYITVYRVGENAGTDYKATSIGFFALWTGYPILFYTGILNNDLAPRTVTIGLVVLPLISKHLYALYDMALTKE